MIKPLQEQSNFRHSKLEDCDFQEIITVSYKHVRERKIKEADVPDIRYYPGKIGDLEEDNRIGFQVHQFADMFERPIEDYMTYKNICQRDDERSRIEGE